MGQRRNNRKSTVATVIDSTRQSKPEVTPLRPANTPSPSVTAASKPSPGRVTGPTHEQIAQRALEIWVKNGSKHGQDERHWLEAEAQLKKEMGIK